MSLETIACTSDVDRLVESDEDSYWELARHDEDYLTLFGDAKHILNFLPELGDIVNSVFPETAMVADIPSFLQKKIDEGDLAFQVDRYGNDIAHLVDRSGRVRHALRLDKKRLTPEMSQAWDNLRTRAVQAEIIRVLYDIRHSIVEIGAGLQDDRLARLGRRVPEGPVAPGSGQGRRRALPAQPVHQPRPGRTCEAAGSWRNTFLG